MAEISYIKQNEPETYKFFVEYWGFVKKYWVPENTQEWWNLFTADLAYYVSKYDNNDFFVDIIMQMYVRDKNPANCIGTKEELTGFLSEWWKYINTYYVTNDSKEWWTKFIDETKQISKKYEGNIFYQGLIDNFISFKTGPEKKIGA